MTNPFLDFSPYLYPGEVIKSMYSIPDLVDVNPGWYFITSSGRIFSASNWNGNRLREMSPAHTPDGYKFIRLTGPAGTKMYRINRLVLFYFGGPIPDNVYELEANHKDHNTANNWVWNLNWLTHAENTLDSGMQGYTGALIDHTTAMCIIDDLNRGDRVVDIARRYNVSERGVRHIKEGNTFRYLNPDNRNWETRGMLSHEEVIDIYMALKNGTATTEELMAKYNKSKETIDAIRRCQYPYKDTLRGYDPILNNGSKCDDETALAIYNELKKGVPVSVLRQKYNVGKSLVTDIKFLRNSYLSLREKYGLEPLDAKTNNIRCTEDTVVAIYKDFRDNRIKLQDAVHKYQIAETTANDIKLCRGAYSYLTEKYGFEPLRGSL